MDNKELLKQNAELNEHLNRRLDDLEKAEKRVIELEEALRECEQFIRKITAGLQPDINEGERVGKKAYKLLTNK